MANDSSATAREETPHVNQTTRTTISDAIRRRAESIIKDRYIDAQSRVVILYGLETNDPWLAELVRRVDSGETIIDTVDFTQEPENREDKSREEKIEVLIEMICRAGDEPGNKSAALLVLMATLENARHPKAISNMAKHIAFTRCGELNVFGMLDAQVAVLEGELLA